MKTTITICAFLTLGCGSSETPPYTPEADGGSPQSDSRQIGDGEAAPETDMSTPTNCVPDEVFCHQGQIRRCNSTGTDSFADHNCSELDFASVAYNCEVCDDGSAQCGPAKPWTTGRLSGHFSMTHEAGDPSRFAENLGCNPTPSKSLTYVERDGTFNHNANKPKPNFGSIMLALKEYNTQGKEILLTCENKSGSFGFLTKSYEQWSSRCDKDQTPPPQMLSVTLVAHSSARPPEYGSQWTIKAKGYMRSANDNSPTPKWVPFFYEAEGVFTTGPND